MDSSAPQFRHPNASSRRQRFPPRLAARHTAPTHTRNNRERGPPPPYAGNDHAQPYVPGFGHPSLPADHLPSSTPSEKRKVSWDVIEQIENQYWRLSSSNGLYRWSLEIFSWIISALCMIAIIIILIFVHGKQQPSWHVDSYVSIISRVATSALLIPTAEAIGQCKWIHFRKGKSRSMWDLEAFDAATRGPMGSLLLILRRKGGTIVALGAAIMLLAVGLDPFFQQVLSFAPREVILQTGNVSLPRVVTYSGDQDPEYVNDVITRTYDGILRPIFLGYFWDQGGLGSTADKVVKEDSTPPIPLSCPTSNCTWPPYESLAVCSACSDISTMLTYTCLPSNSSWRNDRGLLDSNQYPIIDSCGYYFNATSDTPMLMVGYARDALGNPLDAINFRTLNLNERTVHTTFWDRSINFRNRTDVLIDFIVVSIDGSPSDAYQENPGLIAQECVVNWCTKGYASRYSEGVYIEEETHTYQNTDPAKDPWSLSSTILNNITTVDQTYLHNVSIAPPYLLDDTSFTVNNDTSFQITPNWDDFFPSSSILANKSAKPWLNHKLWASPIHTRPWETNLWGSQNNVTRHVENLAHALTNAMRSSNNAELVHGTAFDDQLIVQVSWPWLILPLLVLIASLVFLVMVVIKSSKDTGVWKNSAVATLMHALPAEVQERLQDAGESPQAIAKKVTIELDPEGGSWRMSVAVAKANTEPILSPRLGGRPPGWI